MFLTFFQKFLKKNDLKNIYFFSKKSSIFSKFFLKKTNLKNFLREKILIVVKKVLKLLKWCLNSVWLTRLF